MSKVKKIIRLGAYYLFSILFFVSCVTEKQRKRICSECKSVNSDSVIYKTKETVRDSFIFVSSKPVIQYIKNPCDSLGKLKEFDFVKYNNGVKNIVKSIGGVLVTICEIDSLKARCNFLERKVFEAKKTHEIKEITTNILTSFQKFCIKFFWSITLIVAFYCVYRIIRVYFKI